MKTRARTKKKRPRKKRPAESFGVYVHHSIPNIGKEKPRAVVLLAGEPGTGKTRAARCLFMLLDVLGFVTDIYSSTNPDKAIDAAITYGGREKIWHIEEPS